MTDNRVTNLVISSARNAWGWWVVSGFVDGHLVSNRWDRKPTRAKARETLIKRADALKAGTAY